MTAAPGALYLVPAPLDGGTAQPTDIVDALPFGAIRRAAALTHWLVENAKTTRAVLKRIDAVQRLAMPLQQLSIVELPRPPKGTSPAAQPDASPLLAPLHDGHDVGLMSEAGLPGVADPGAAVVAAAHAAGIAVVPLAGSSSLTLALAATGLNGQSFAFVGYLPVDANARAQRLRELEKRSRQERQTQLLIETPYRNAAMADALLAHLAPDTRLSIALGLTLPGGWCRTRTIAQWRGDPPALAADVPAVFALLAG